MTLKNSVVNDCWQTVLHSTVVNRVICTLIWTAHSGDLGPFCCSFLRVLVFSSVRTVRLMVGFLCLYNYNHSYMSSCFKCCMSSYYKWTCGLMVFVSFVFFCVFLYMTQFRHWPDDLHVQTWPISRRAKMNFLCQGFGKLLPDRQTYGQTRLNCIPCRFTGGQLLSQIGS